MEKFQTSKNLSIFSIFLYRTLPLKEVKIVYRWPRPPIPLNWRMFVFKEKLIILDNNWSPFHNFFLYKVIIPLLKISIISRSFTHTFLFAVYDLYISDANTFLKNNGSKSCLQQTHVEGINANNEVNFISLNLRKIRLT